MTLMGTLKTIDEVVTGDIDGEFLHTASNRCAWAYSKLFDDIVKDPSIPPDLREEAFTRRRATAVMGALASAADKHGVPYDFRKLSSNGQRKLILRTGRITLIQEAVQKLYSSPTLSDYKVELSRCQGVLQQLELNLGDMPNRMIDFSGNMLGVLLHGSAGTRFNRHEKSLGSFMLGIPNPTYENWIRRFDLHDLALFGFGTENKTSAQEQDVPAKQEDKVRVRTRRRSAKAAGE